jgi:hypothetical protein
MFVKWLQHMLYIYKCCFYSISGEIFVTDTIRVRLIPYSIYIYLYSYQRQFISVVVSDSYPCPNPNPRKNMKTNMISTVSVHILSVFIHTHFHPYSEMTLIVEKHFCLGNEDDCISCLLWNLNVFKCPNGMVQEHFYRHFFFQEQLTIAIQSTWTEFFVITRYNVDTHARTHPYEQVTCHHLHIYWNFFFYAICSSSKTTIYYSVVS